MFAHGPHCIPLLAAMHMANTFQVVHVKCYAVLYSLACLHWGTLSCNMYVKNRSLSAALQTLCALLCFFACNFAHVAIPLWPRYVKACQNVV